MKKFHLICALLILSLKANSKQIIIMSSKNILENFSKDIEQMIKHINNERIENSKITNIQEDHSAQYRELTSI